VGFYGADRPERVDESSAPGSDFMAQVCLAWESAADPARAAGARVVHVRLGVVLVQVFLLALDDDQLQGPVNAVGPEELKNAGFTKALGEALGRWTKIPVPAAGIKLIFGEMGEKLLLKGQNVRPGLLEERSFEFEYPRIKGALMDLVG